MTWSDVIWRELWVFKGNRPELDQSQKAIRDRQKERKKERKRERESGCLLDLSVVNGKNNLLVKSGPMTSGLIPRGKRRHDEEEETGGGSQKEADSESDWQSDASQKIDQQEPSQGPCAVIEWRNDGQQTEDQHVGQQPSGVGEAAGGGHCCCCCRRRRDLSAAKRSFVVGRFLPSANVEAERCLGNGHDTRNACTDEHKRLKGVRRLLFQRQAHSRVDGHQTPSQEETIEIRLFGTLTVPLIKLFKGLIVKSPTDHFGPYCPSVVVSRRSCWPGRIVAFNSHYSSSCRRFHR